MSLLLRRIVQNRSVSKATPIARAFVTYPLGRDPCSLPEINTNVSTSIDPRPIPLRYRVRAMIEMSNLDKAAEISHLAVLDEFRDDIKDTVFICNSVIGAMCDAKRYDEAMSLFNYFFNEYQALPNTLSCNLIIKAHCDLGRVDDALQLYRHIVAPGIETYRILTKALVDAKRFDEACDLVVARSSCDFVVYDILIRGFLDIGEFVKASQILQELKGGPDSSSSKLPWREYHKAIAFFNVSFIKYWFKQGKDEVAMEIYAGLEKAQVMKPIVGNRVLQVLVEHGKKTEAWELFEEMIDTCDSETVGIIMSSKNFSQKTIPIERLRKTCYKTVIASLCEQGKVSEAEKLFAEMFSDDYDDHLLVVGPDVPTFRAMINGYVKVGRVDDALKMLDKMNISYLRKLAIHRAT